MTDIVTCEVSLWTLRMREFMLLLLLALLEKGRAGTCVPPTLAHGSVSGQGDSRRWTGRFSCRPGFTLVGSNRLKCQSGTWSSSPPLCAGGDCDPDLIPQVVHAEVHSHKPRKFRGSVYTYSCDHGFKRFSGHNIVCVAGTWTSAELTVCAKSGCDESLVTHIPFGEAARRADGAIYTFRCNEGGVMEGPGAVFCDGSRWNGSTPHCMHGPERVELSGPESARSGAGLEYDCATSASNPPATIEWKVSYPWETASPDSPHTALEQVFQASEVWTGQGWETRGRAVVRATEGARALLVSCTATSQRLGLSVSMERLVRLHYPPDGVEVFGPTTVHSGQEVELKCESQPAFPAPLLMWMIRRDGEEMEGTAKYKVKDEEKGVTSISTLHFTAGAVGQMEVDCSAEHEALGEKMRVGNHTINIIESLTESTETSEDVVNEAQDATKTSATELKEEVSEVKSLQASSSTTINLSYLLPLTVWTSIRG